MLADDSNTKWPEDGNLGIDCVTYGSLYSVPAVSAEHKTWMNNRLDWIRREPGYAP
jgi:hypothetical protein